MSRTVIKPGSGANNSANAENRMVIKPNQGSNYNQQNNTNQNWYSGNQPTSYETFGQIGKIFKEDPAAGNQIWGMFQQERRTPGNSAYFPYLEPTSRAASALQSYGVDPSSVMNDTSFLDRLAYNGTSNTPSKPGKKASRQEQVDYWSWQYMKGEEDTQTAEAEWDALKKDVAYRATKDPRNPSPQSVVKEIDWSKYPTLNKARNANPGQPMALNRGIDFSDDSIMGVYWAAKNGGGTGNPDADIMLSAAGEGEQWKEDPEITAKLDSSNPETYDRYSVGCTMMNEAAYFGVPSFSETWLDDNKDILQNGTDAEKKMYLHIRDRDKETVKAEEQKAAFDKKVQSWKDRGYSAEKIINEKIPELLQDPKYNLLSQMDDSINDGLTDGWGILEFTRPIGFNRKSTERDIASWWAGVENNDAAPVQISNELQDSLGIASTVFPAGINEFIRNANNVSGDATESLYNNATDNEKENFDKVPGPIENIPVTTPAPAAEEPKAETPKAEEPKAETPAVSPEEAQKAAAPSPEPTKTPAKQTNEVLNAPQMLAETIANSQAKLMPQMAEKMTNDNSQVYLDNATTISEYDRYSQSRDFYEQQRISLETKLGDKLALLQEEEGGIELEEEEPISVNGKNLLVDFWLDDETGEYVIDTVKDASPNAVTGQDNYYMREGMELGWTDGLTLEAIEDAAADKLAALNERQKALASAKEKNLQLTEEDRTAYKNWKAYTAMIDQCDQYMGMHQTEYDEASKRWKESNENTNLWLNSIIGDASDPDSLSPEKKDMAQEYVISDACAKTLGAFSQGYVYVPSYNDTYESLMDLTLANLNGTEYEIEVGAGMNAGIFELLKTSADAQYQQSLTFKKNIDFAEEYAKERGWKIPDNIQRGMDEYRLQLQHDIEGYEYAQYMNEPDFMEVATRTRKAQPWLFGQDYNATESEELVYYYLWKKVGPDAAKKYHDEYLMPILGARGQESGKQFQKNLASRGTGGAILSTLLGICSAPAEPLLGAAWIGESIKNRRFNGASGLLALAKGNEAGHAEVVEHIRDAIDNPFWKEVAAQGYSLLYSRGRSFVMGLSFGGLSSATGGVAGELSHAAPMAFGAATSAMAEAANNGATPWQTIGIGVVTFMAEDFTEALELTHMSESLNGYAMSNFKSAFMRWLLDRLPNMLSEGIGETLNDIFEGNLEHVILGDNSEFSKNVNAILMSGQVKTLDEAKRLAKLNEYKKYAMTFASSSLGELLNFVPFTWGQIRNRIDYSHEVKRLNSIGIQTTIPDLRATYDSIRDRVENNEINIDDLNDRSYYSSLVLTGLAERSDANTRAVAMTTMLSADQAVGSVEEAAAAYVHLTDVFGEDSNPVEEVRRLVDGAKVAKTTTDGMKQGLRYAALSAQSESRKVMQSEIYQAAAPYERVGMLAEAAAKDAQNEAVLQEVSKAVHDNRVAEKMKLLMSQGEAKPSMDADKKVRQKRRVAKKANDTLQKAKAETQAKAEALQQAAAEAAETGDFNRTEEVGAMASSLEKADKVVEEYQQSSDEANAQQAEAEQDAERVKSQNMNDIRQQAEQMVAGEDMLREEARKVDEMVRQLAESEQAKAQAAEDEQSGKAWEDKRDTLVESLLDRDHLEGEEREAKRQEYLKRAEQIRLGNIDMTGLMNNVEGFMAVSSFGRKLNLQFKLDENLGNARGKYKDGVIYLNSNLIKNGKMTIGQALVEASLHEITHSMENTKNYKTYSDTVLKYLFHDDDNNLDNDKLNSAIEQKQADYRRLVGQELSRPEAIQEIVADFARTHLNDREVVQRFLEVGLAGKMRNTLHNINQALKNFRLKGDEKVQAEYLRRAERLFQRAMDEVAKSSIHPEGGQFSVMQFAQSAGLTFDENTYQLFDQNGKEIKEVTPEMMDNTPVGMLIDYGLKGEQRTKAKEMMAGLMNMIVRYKDSDLVWEIGASTLSSTFSAIKSNSDPQYKTTVDFGTVCAKTQAIIDVMTQVMLDRVKEGKTGGLTREDVMKVYDATHNAGLSVPCPVCYVFSRWMGVPSLLGQMSQYQHDFVVTNESGAIDVKATQKNVDKYIKNAEDQYGSAKEINNRKAKLQSQQAELEKQREKATTKEEEKELLAKMVDLDKKIGEVSAYNWVTQALCKKTKTGKYVVDPKFKLTPDEILFDLNRTGEFAKYEKNWRYRNTRGAGMGKAIMPYSGITIGDILYGVKKEGRQSSLKNPWLNNDPKAAKRQLDNARIRARKQNLVGGQRLQSTSDFRPEWGLDYIMSFLELQAAGSKTQMYTKVPDAVDFFASVGADVNLSIMGKGNGFHEATEAELAAMTPEQRERATVDGKVYVLDFSNITGMDFGKAKALKDKYDNVQMILVGMNDTHIKLALANEDIDFIIPWHSSGNSKEVLAKLISTFKGEKLSSSVDYTTTQTDMVKGTVKKYTNEKGEKVEYTVPGQQTAEQKQLWDARVKLLTKGGDALTLEDRNILKSNPITKRLYERFTVKGVDDDCYGVRLTKDQATQIFPYEYWDTTSTKENADENGKTFVAYCEAMGIVPRFSQFKDEKGYWKLLIDRPMYNNDGSYHQQHVIDVTNARIGELNDSGKLTNSDLPTTAEAKYAPTDPRNKHYQEYTDAEKRAVDMAKASIEEQYDDGSDGQYSVYGDMTDADIDQALSEALQDRDDAVSRGDTKAEEIDSEFIGDAVGITEPSAMENIRKETEKSMQSSFAKSYDEWDKTSEGIIFKVGRPSDALLSIGVPDNEIRLTSNEVLHIKKKHPGMSDDVIKQIPSIVDNPILVMESFTVPDRITMFGELLDDNGAPVLAILTTNPEKDVNANVDFLKMNSAYGKDTYLQEFIDKCKILYQNENRAAAWAASLRLNLPSASAQNGSTNDNIAQARGDVNGQLSAGGETTLADIDQGLVNSGVLSQEEVDAYSGVPGIPSNMPGMPLPGEGGSAQRQFGYQTAQTSDALHQEVKDYLFNNSRYTPDSNSAQIDRAVDWVRSLASGNDSDGYYAAVNAVTSDSFDYRSADGQARMLTAMSMAALKGDLSTELRLADAYNRQGTDLGRMLQARKIFRLMTPIGRMSVLQNMADRINESYAEKGKETRVKLSPWLLEAASVAKTEEDFDKVRDAAMEELADQMPADWKSALRSFRMMAMLLNPRTHIRNVIGNALFVPAVSLKNKMGAVFERGMKDKTKTLSMVLPKEIRDFARQDAKAQKGVLTGEGKYNETSKIEMERNEFGKGKLGLFLKDLSDFNSIALEGEDWFFLKGHYRRALGGWIHANGYTIEQLQNNPDLLEKGREYATNEAQKATYRDFNEVAKRLNDFTRNPKSFGGKVVALGVEAVLPFKKTPINILRRGIEYSPIGIVKSLTTDRIHLKQYLDYQKGKLSELPSTAITPNQFVDNLCSGLTGTMVTMLGGILSSAGVVSVGFGDDEDEFDKLEGAQEYAIRVRLFGKDITYTLDWAAPMCMPFFTGAMMYETFKDGFDPSKFANSILSITEPLYNLSMLEGVGSVFKTSQNDDTNQMTQLLVKMGTNYLSSYVPSALGAAARVRDPMRRKAYVPSGQGSGPMGTINYAVEQMENKLPGASETNIPVRDAYGRTKETTKAYRVFENFLSPGYASEIKKDPVTEEQRRLFKTGESGMIPKLPNKTFSANGERYALSAEEYDRLTVDRGQTAYNLITDLMDTNYYQNADDPLKASMIRDVWTYATQNANYNINSGANVDNWVLGSRANPIQGIINRAKDKDEKDTIDFLKSKAAQAVQDNDPTALDTCLEGLSVYDTKNSNAAKKAKSAVESVFKPQYIRAYQENDKVKRLEIEEKLENSGLGFSDDDYEEWISKSEEYAEGDDYDSSSGGGGGAPGAMPSRPSSDNGWDQYMADLDDYWAGYDFDSNDPTEQNYGGTIDLNNRQVVHNDDDSISTEYSFSFYDEGTGKEVLIPQVVDGRIVSQEEAIDHYYETGEHLGMFDDWRDADEYAMMLHNRNNWYYNR